MASPQPLRSTMTRPHPRSISQAPRASVLLAVVLATAWFPFVAAPSASAVETYSKVVSGLPADGVQDDVSVQQAETDPDGVVYVAGSARGGARFAQGLELPRKTVGDPKLEPADVFVGRIDPQGNWMSVNRILLPLASSVSELDTATTPRDEITVTDVTVGNTNVYVTGYFKGNNCGFVARLDLAGRPVWTRYVVASIATAQAVVEGLDGSVYFGGSFAGSAETVQMIGGSLSRVKLGATDSQTGDSSAYLVKLDAAGNVAWFNSTLSLSAMREEVVALESDGNGDIHVLMNLRGGSIDIRNAGGTVFQPKVKLDYVASPWVGKIGANGIWKTGRAIATSDLGGIPRTGSSASAFTEVVATDLKLVAGKAFVSGASSTAYSGVPLRRGFITRLSAVDYLADGAVAHFISGDANKDILAHPLRLRGAGRTLFAVGHMPPTLEIYGEIPSSAGDPGTKDLEITGLQSSLCVSSFDTNLRPLWIRTTARPDTVLRPRLVGNLLAYDSASSRVYWGGQFLAVGRDKLLLGEPPAEVALTITNIDARVDGSPRGWGWLTAFDSEGRPIRQVRLTVESQFSPINVNGSAINTTNYTDTVLEGATVKISVADQESNGTRRVVSGYTTDTEAGSSPANNLTTTLLTDAKVRFMWKVLHRLRIQSDHESAGLLGTASAGDPQPMYGDNWIEHGASVDATVSGYVLPVESSDWGSRYVVKSYVLTRSSTIVNQVTQTVDRIQVKPLKDDTFTQPATLQYQWKKQFRVALQVSNPDAGSLVLARQTSVNPFVTKTGAGEHWFDADATLEIMARGTNAAKTLVLRGWDFAHPVPQYFAKSSFRVDPNSADIRGQLMGPGGLWELNLSGAAHYGRSLNNLSRPVTISWNFGDPIQTTNLAIGVPFTFPTVNGKTPSKSGWTQIRVLDAPPGSIGTDMMVWDPKNQRGITTRPGIFQADVPYTDNTSTNTVVWQIYTDFGGEPWRSAPQGPNRYSNPAGAQRHIAGTPGVDLDPSKSDGHFFHDFRYSSADGLVANGRFTASTPGRSVLLFSSLPTGASGSATGDLTREDLTVRVVETINWNSASVLKTNTTAVPIGSPLTSTDDLAKLGTGFVVHEIANYNPNVYDRARVAGPIIPVNGRLTPGNVTSNRELVVVWYRTDLGANWPTQPVFYPNFAWPSPQANRIVIASRLGSEGLDGSGNRQTIFDPEIYEDVQIYNQPDPTRPGYNPNEEHARIYPSLHGLSGATSVPAAFALRDDLNITGALIAASRGVLKTNQYTSDPFVLVQFRHKATGQGGMAIYSVVRQDALTSDPWAAELPGATGPSYSFTYRMVAGERVTAPYPLNLVMGLSPCVNTVSNLFSSASALPNGSYFTEGAGSSRAWFIDHKKGLWAVAGDSFIRAYYTYPIAPDFWYPFDLDFRDVAASKVGDCVTWLPTLDVSSGKLGVFDPDVADYRIRYEPTEVTYATSWPQNPPVLKAGETLTYAGGEYKADNPEAPGLPGILGFAAAEIVFDSKNPKLQTSTLDPVNWGNSFSARVMAPLEDRLIPLPRTSLPSNLNAPTKADITVDGDTWYFNKLPPSLQKRVFYKPLARAEGSTTAGALVLRGFVNDRTLGDSDLTATPPPVYVLEPNVLTPRERTDLLKLSSDSPGLWDKAINDLFALSRNPRRLSTGGWQVGLEHVANSSTDIKPLAALGPGLALVTNPRLLHPDFGNSSSNYITLAENNHASLGDAPVTLHVIRVDPTQRYRGAIKTILPVNAFDEKITLRHTADFGGNVDDMAFAWWYREEDGTVKPGDVPPGGNGGSPVWQVLDGSADGQTGQVQIDLHGNPTLLLADNLFFARYRYRQALVAEPNWSVWAGAANSSSLDLDGDGRPDLRPQLAMGWVKRVLDAINPYEARVREFARNTSPATASSLIRQLGAPYVGPVALNASKNVVENLGLIELYETVLNRTRAMTIDSSSASTSSGINAAILLASTRLANFYTLLAHEAWDDALDPTLGYGGATTEPGNLNPARFCFENQQPSLLAEELALLRGADESLGRPVFNRLFWNFTKGEGEVAYALNYQIADVNQDGFIDESDAMKQYPMGHGDAWGHFLSAMRKRYDLLRSPLFDWENRGEYYNLLDVVLGVDFQDERNFARTAAARAQVGAEIVQLTFRARYSEAADSKLSGYTDPDTDRAWGVTEWARRTAQAALFDWVTANAITPFEYPDNTETLDSKIDRRNLPEIAQIATHLNGIQVALDGANSGLNALGLDPDVLPFDIDPTHIDVGSTAQIGRTAVQGLSHYEQLYERAFEALRNASLAFDYANQQKALNRKIEADAEQLRREAVAKDREFRNRLIEIFGTPYEGQIGPGKAYPAGYSGPDLNLFMYVDVNAITPATVPTANDYTYFDEYVSFHALTNDVPEEFQADLTEHFLNDISLGANTAVELLGDDRFHLRLPARASDYAFVAPPEWGQRAAPGRLQTIVGEMLQVQSDLSLAVGDYDYLIKQIRDRVDMLRMRAEIDTEILGIREAHYNTVVSLTAVINALRAGSAAANFAVNVINDIAEATIEGVPKTVDDLFFGVRVTLRTATAVSQLIQRSAALLADQTANVVESSKEIIDLRDGIDIDRKEMSVELRGMLHEIEELLVNEGVTRIRLFREREQLRGVLDRYRATLQEGLRLLEEREGANIQFAARAQDNRYHDVLFRTGRHESIQRFRALFDLAQRYCYMTAKAYDYETNFDTRDRASAQPFLNEIVRTRTLGKLSDNLPIPGTGLAGTMARLQDNFRAVEGRLGFNNFQLDTTGFSLRHELLRRASVESWTNALAQARRTDLWELSEFRRFCRPFAPRGAPQPGIVLTFGTQVIAGYNFFGQELGPKDSAYDPSLYATKIRAAGIKFQGYPIERLSRTPYVYLVPAGLDRMIIPNSPDFTQRTWNVMDQAIPAPHHAGTVDLAKPTWLPNIDTLTGALGEIRRFSSFRAGVTDEDPALNVTRFIGRSVWNDAWLLIIPGQSLNHDADQGLDEFINSVTDITLHFETYGYSGN